MFAVTRKVACAAALSLLAAGSRADEPASSLCASADQQKAIRARYETPERGLVEKLRAELGISEAAVLSALPADRAVGVPGSAFHAVWDSLRQWPEAVVALRSGGHVLEVYGPVHAGERSRVSQYFNLSTEGSGLSGHLRPDLVGAIYATRLPGRSGDDYGVIFYDGGGQPSFGVYVPSEHAKASDDALRAFGATRDLMNALPRGCPDTTSTGAADTPKP